MRAEYVEETERGEEDRRQEKERIVCTVQAIAWLRLPAVEFLGGWDSPDVGQHQNERADYDNLQDLPIIAIRPIAAQSCHPWHQ